MRHTDLGKVAAGVLHGDDRTHIVDAVDDRPECQLLQLLLRCFMTRMLLCRAACIQTSGQSILLTYTAVAAVQYCW